MSYTSICSSKLIYPTICLWIFLSTDNVLTLVQYDTGGVYHNCSQVKLTVHHICLWYLSIYLYIYIYIAYQ